MFTLKDCILERERENDTEFSTSSFVKFDRFVAVHVYVTISTKSEIVKNSK